MTGKTVGAAWDPQGPGAEALWKGPKGDKGEPGLSPKLRKGIVALFSLAAAIAVAALVGVVVQSGSYQTANARTVRKLNHTVNKLSREVKSQCRFDGDLAGLPLTVNPATHTASELGVKIVSDSRVAWHQAGCPGRLAAPSPSFARWARYYHLPTG